MFHSSSSTSVTGSPSSKRMLQSLPSSLVYYETQAREACDACFDRFSGQFVLATIIRGHPLVFSLWNREPKLILTASSSTAVSLIQEEIQARAEATTQSISQTFRVSAPSAASLLSPTLPSFSTHHSSSYHAPHRPLGYLNAVTMKSACWAGEDDDWVAAGSDSGEIFLWDLSRPEIRAALTAEKGSSSSDHNNHNNCTNENG